MSHKRSAGFNHYDTNRSKQTKRYSSQHPDIVPNSRPAQRVYNSQNPDAVSHSRPRPDHNVRSSQLSHGPPHTENKIKTRDNPVLHHIERLPDPTKCEPCKLAADEFGTGLVALLSKLEAEETTFQGDRKILHHARELRRLLSNRGDDQSHLSALKQTALEQKWPKKSEDIIVPKYILQQLEKAQSLPPLPPITEPYLQEAVFTHASVYTHGRVRGSDNSNDITYERLEFLGDAYIELIASRLIYSRLPHVDVPQQASLREQLVKNETLGQFSMAYGLPDRLKHGAHIKESKAWNKIVADVFEAYVAGVVLSDPHNGFETAESWLTKLWAPQMLDFQPKIIENPAAKDDLARLLQTKDVSLDYREEKDMIHENGVQKYCVGLYLTGWGHENEWLGSGEGRSKAQAAVYAAMDALKRDSDILKNAAKMKQELMEQRQARRDAIAQEKEEAKAAKFDEASAKEVDGKADVPPRNIAYENEEKLDSKDISASDPFSWLEESNRKEKGGSAQNHASWLEKEMKKKEKKEKKRKRTTTSTS